jgi:hypothetical protein
MTNWWFSVPDVKNGKVLKFWQSHSTSISHVIADNIDYFGFDKKVVNVEQMTNVRRLTSTGNAGFLQMRAQFNHIGAIDALSDIDAKDRELIESSWHERDQYEKRKETKE